MPLWWWATCLVNEKAMRIVVSSVVIKELSYVLGKKYSIIENYFAKQRDIKIVRSIPDDYENARALERRTNFSLSFGDCLHASISERLKCTLVTWDKGLLQVAESVVPVAKPINIVS